MHIAILVTDTLINRECLTDIQVQLYSLHSLELEIGQICQLSQTVAEAVPVSIHKLAGCSTIILKGIFIDGVSHTNIEAEV